MAPSSSRVLSYDPQIFEHRGSLHVHAVFPHAWHLRSKSGQILSLVDSQWNGPLTMRIAGMPARHRVFPRMGATLTEAGLEVGAAVLSFAGARPWTESVGGFEALNLAALRADQEHIRGKVHAAARGGLAVGGAVGKSPTSHACRMAAPPGMKIGDGCLVNISRREDREPSATERRATPVMHMSRIGSRHFRRRGDATDAWLIRGEIEMALLGEMLVQQDAVRVSRHATGLMGLGPGLTPSGDDVLCGLIAGLSVLGHRSVHQRERCDGAVAVLATCIAREAPRRTTSLSATLLQCAVRGVVAEPLLQVLGTVGSGNRLTGVDEVLMLGHSSGSDMLTGALMACAVLVRWEELFGPAMVGPR